MSRKIVYPEIKIPKCSEKPLSPFFSVLLLAYNQADCIKRAISSVLNQTCQDFELVIIDDCSTDNTYEVLSECKSINKKITIERQQKNSGCLIGRKTGVSIASGKWILFLDGDDWLNLDALEKIKNEIEKNPNYDMFEMPFIERPSNKIFYPPKSAENRFEQFFKNSNLMATVWNKVYKAENAKQAFDKMLSLRVNVFEDVCESIVLAYFCPKLMPLNIVLTNYLNINTGISTQKNDLQKFEAQIDSLKNTITVLENFQKSCGVDAEKYQLSFIRTRMLDWIFHYIVLDCNASDGVKLFYRINHEFPEDVTHTYLERIYSNYLKAKNFAPYRFFKNFINFFKKGN